MATHVETGRARRQYIHEAGWNTTSGASVLAGTFVAFGAVTLVAAAAGAAGSALGLDTDGISTDEWRRAGVVGAVIGAMVMFAAFWFGGYTAGRMSRRAGARHGVLVFALSVAVVGIIALVTWAVGDADAVHDALRDNGVPTDESTWSDIGVGAGIAAAVAMLVGAVLGGIRGDRWHGRLATAVVERREEPAPVPHHTTAIGHTWVDEPAVDITRDHDRTTELSIEDEREIARSG